MTFLQALVLFIAAMLGGALNSVAGGGSFISFPALVITGVLPINANATSTVALWPGSVASVSAYHKELALVNRALLVVLSVTSLIGGVLGAILLVRTSQSTFVRLIPYLLLLATLLFTFGQPITTRLRKLIHTEPVGDIPSGRPRLSWFALAVIAFFQLIIAIYGGYFGGGIGILMLATLGFMGMENIHVMNGLKTVLQTCINGVAVITFIIAGVVEWPQAIVMIVGAIVGGFGCAYYARKLDPRIVRGFVILVGITMTIYFFVR
jgi:uncharacterized membrane protein YfcA